jgi:hypothetical protein
VQASVVSRAESNLHHTQFFLNGDLNPVDDATWFGKAEYSFVAPITQSSLIEGENSLEFKMPYNGSNQDMYFDWYEISYGREFQALGDQLHFSYDVPGTWQFWVEGLDSNTVSVLDITHPLTPTRILTPTLTDAGGTYTAAFEGEIDSSREYLVAGAAAELSPKAIQAYTPEDFLGSTGVDYVFITHPDLITETQRLANYRATQGHTTRVISVEELYNQFNYGIYHPIAIKNFLTFTFANWTTPPTYVLLVGGGHWNFKGYSSFNSPPIYMPPNLAYVDPWQGEVDSANLLATVVGLDIFPDVSIARMPANSSAELAVMIDKVLAYEAAPYQEWQRHILFIADNTPDPAGDFVTLTEGIVEDYLIGRPQLKVDRIYFDDYEPELCDQEFQEPYRNCPVANHAITTTLNITGALLVNYSGHASLNRWTHEKIFINEDLPSLINGKQLPVFLSMTCLDGYWIHPDIPGLIPELLLAEGKGGIAAFSATGLGVATGHDYLQRGFFSALFELGEWKLGPAAQNAKLNLFTQGISYDLIHTFTVFGDPALQIQSPYGAFLPAIRR